jgi:hypothetical protein
MPFCIVENRKTQEIRPAHNLLEAVSIATDQAKVTKQDQLIYALVVKIEAKKVNYKPKKKSK